MTAFTQPRVSGGRHSAGRAGRGPLAAEQDTEQDGADDEQHEPAADLVAAANDEDDPAAKGKRKRKTYRVQT